MSETRRTNTGVSLHKRKLWRLDWCHCKECELQIFAFFFLFLLSFPVQGHIVPVNSMSNCASSLVLKGERELSRIPDASEGCTKRKSGTFKTPAIHFLLSTSKLFETLANYFLWSCDTMTFQFATELDNI